MGIFKNGNDVSGIYIGKNPVLAVYVGDQKVWPLLEIIQSCFSNGYWADLYPWLDNTPWID